MPRRLVEAAAERVVQAHQGRRRATAELTDDQHRQALLPLSAIYVTAKLAFADAIVVAKRAGIDEDEIAHVTGLTVPMIRAVLRTPS
jgi:hypothetical protein